MKQLPIQLPDSFIKGLVCKVHVSLNGKTGTKELKVCSIKARSITFIEVDRENRQNIFRKVDRKDIVNFKPTAICEITVRDGILPVKWESAWDSIGQPTQQIRGRGLASQFSKHFSTHSKGWAPTIKAPMGSSIDALAANPSWKNSTTNSAAGFPMV
jgi:hypothetical protein